MLRAPTPRSAVRRTAAALGVALVTTVTAALAFVLLAAGPAWADAPGPQVHHVLPENGAVLRTSPDHVEIMFDVELVPGRVDIGIAPDATGSLVALPSPPVLDGPLLVQPLPPLPAGRYTVGVRLLGSDGRISRGTFGFAVDPAAGAPATAAPAVGTSTRGPGTWVVPLIGVALALPAVGVALRRRRSSALRRRRSSTLRQSRSSGSRDAAVSPHGVTPRRPAAAAVPAGPGRAAGRTPTSASSPAARPGR